MLSALTRIEPGSYCSWRLVPNKAAREQAGQVMYAVTIERATGQQDGGTVTVGRIGLVSQEP